MKTNNNILSEKRPDLAAEWHLTKNGDLTPDDVTYGSGRKVWWTCLKGHEWEANIRSRNKGSGCPYCSGNKVCKDTSLATVNPQLAKEWHLTMNGDLTPNDVTCGSNKRVWWICSNGHEWETRVADRLLSKNKTGVTRCPYCIKPKGNKKEPAIRNKKEPTMRIRSINYVNGTSFPEQAILFYMKQIFYDTISRHKIKIKNTKFEIDIFIPSLNLGLEYDGFYFHKEKTYEDESKDEALKNLIKLIRIREEGLPRLKTKIFRTFNRDNKKNTSLQKVIKDVLFFIAHLNVSHEIKQKILKLDIDLNRDGQQIYEMFEYSIVVNSLKENNPRIASEWHPTKNGKLSPNRVLCGSEKKVWWICFKGHEWEAAIYLRNRGQDCPYCSGKKVLNNNSLNILNPILASEWHPIKNGNLTPSDVTCKSDKKVWWKCLNGHEWEESIFNRNRGYRCPHCLRENGRRNNASNKLDSELIEEWHPTKNGDLTPDKVTIGSVKKVWWVCSKGHEWETTVSTRSRGSRCPYCVGQKVCKENSLATLKPKVAMGWDYTKNGTLTPNNVTCSSNKRVWWRCEKGHEWETRVADRFLGTNKDNGTSCPYCSGKKK